jgi:pimeloyl-ACP methyl ester carboxylesterase
MECKLENITVFYEQFGEGRPVIMLHGWPVDHRHMVKDFEPLFQAHPGWKRIYPDMPGMGRTPGEAWIHNQDLMLGVLLDFIDALIPGQQFAVAGTSYGGYLARGLVHQRTSDISGVMLMTPAMTMDDKKNLPQHVTLVKDEALLTSLDPEEASFFKEFAVVQSAELLDSLRSDIYPAFEVADHAFLEKMRGSRNFTFDIDMLPEPFDKPALFLLGRQDATTGYAEAWKILEDYPRATFVVLDRAGHGLGAEQKQLFESLTNEWLNRVEESI